MKAIIPVAGVGSKLRPHTHTHPKALIPVAGKPILAHIIDSLAEAGVRDFVFVVGYLGEKIKEFVEVYYPNYNNAFVVQSNREGIGDAIWQTREEIKDEDEIVVALGDTIFELNLPQLLNNEHSTIATKKVQDPRNFGVAEMDEDHYIQRLVEKPAIPKSNHAIVGVYKIQEVQALLEALQYNIENDIRTHNEFQITDAIMHMIEQGIPIVGFNIDNWFDCGKKETLIDTNATLLKKPEFVTENNQFESTIVIPPVNIDPNCNIENSIIGPYVSIGDQANLHYAIVRNSIIGSHAQIQNAMLNSSIIGSDATLQGVLQSLNIGDSTEINYE